MIIRDSNRKEKRFVAIFPDNSKVHFGLDGGRTYIDHGDKETRWNYIARHKVREHWNNPKSAGALSRWILWGPNEDINKNIEYFNNKFNIK